IYNWDTKKYFDVTSSGNSGIQLQQLVVLAGKRGKQLHLAELNTQAAQWNFLDLTRALRYQLRTDFFTLFYLQQLLAFYDKNLSTLRQTVHSVEAVYANRSILLSEVLRLKSLLFSLETERLKLLDQMVDIQGELHTLVGDSTFSNSYFIPQAEPQRIDEVSPSPLSIEQLMETAKSHRPDVMSIETAMKTEEANLSLQRSLAIPDITVGGLWSRQGSYIPNYYAVTLQFDLPILNRNQGNIRTSEENLEADIRTYQSSLQRLEKDIHGAFDHAVAIDSMYRSFDKKFTGEYRDLVAGMVASYEKRNVNIIEFTDFFESYRTSVVQMQQLQIDRMNAFENLNYVVGTTLMNP
ncbi:MAG TPA: TolC family protein, partial [Bacteroidota bacterium]|nr:TolC family protein [Bacteroidota bacterium]